MEEILKKLSSKLRTTEIDSASEAVIRLYKEFGELEKDAFLKIAMAEIEGLSAQITNAIMQNRILSKLDDADSVRDKAVKELGTLLDGYAVIPVEEKRFAARNLQAVFAKYGKGIVNKSYASESSLIESMLGDFDAPELSADIESLEGVATCLKSLREAEDTFKKVSDNYTADMAGKGESATGIKKQLLNAINTKLLPYLEAMESAGFYGRFIEKVSLEVDRANAAAARHGAKPGEKVPVDSEGAGE